MIKFKFILLILTLTLAGACSSKVQVKQENVTVIESKQKSFTKIPDDVKETKNTQSKVIYLEKGEMTAKDITQSRDISKYNDGGYFDCRGWIAKDETRGECDEKKIRDFIWEHWTEQKRGYIRVTYDSVDAKSTSHIFIEPNEKGKWRIARRIVRLHAIPELNNRITEVQTLFQVKRIENKPKKDEWAIILQNSEGKTIYKIPEF